ncbi:MAG: hypothetical protein ACFFCS_23780 [Candidatus Hodarchaeota archaeon]
MSAIKDLLANLKDADLDKARKAMAELTIYFADKFDHYEREYAWQRTGSDGVKPGDDSLKELAGNLDAMIPGFVEYFLRENNLYLLGLCLANIEGFFATGSNYFFDRNMKVENFNELKRVMPRLEHLSEETHENVNDKFVHLARVLRKKLSASIDKFNEIFS